MKKTQQRGIMENGWAWKVGILAGEELPEMTVNWEMRDDPEWATHIARESFASCGNCKCKGPEVGNSQCGCIMVSDVKARVEI